MADADQEKEKPSKPSMKKTFMTAVFSIHNPSKTKRAVLNDCLRRYHLAYSKVLDLAVAKGLQHYKGKRTTKIEAELMSDFGARINPYPLSGATKAGLWKDIAASISSYLELESLYEEERKKARGNDAKLERLSPPGEPTVPRLIPKEIEWWERLEKFTKEVTLDKETFNRAQLLKEVKAGTLRPALFPRYRQHDGFLLLRHKEKGRFYVLLNTHGQDSRFAKPVDLTCFDVMVGAEIWNKLKNKQATQLRATKKLSVTKTCRIFPLSFGEKYQNEKYLRYLKAANEVGESDDDQQSESAIEVNPKTAKLIARNERYEVHVAFEICAPPIAPQVMMGIDRGIRNLASLCIIDKDGNIIDEENFSGHNLKYVQKIEENLQREKQKKGKKYRSRTRRSEADKAIHAVANRIVAMAQKYRAQVVIEHLGNLTKRNFKRRKSNFKRMLGRQQFAKLAEVLEYKLSRGGLSKSVAVHPRDTSRACSECGNIEKDNRDRDDPSNRFHCQKCGYKYDADLNAARNIALKRKWRENLPSNKKSYTFVELQDTEHSFASFLKRLSDKRHS